MIEKENIIDLHNYENFYNLLNSSDEENSVVAMSILDKVHIKKALPYVLLLLKDKSNIHSNSIDYWKKHAPNLIKSLESMEITPGGNISYKKIIALTKEQCPPEALQFVLDKFGEVLKGYLISWGIDFITDIDLKLKFKKDD